jgi:hypothetical protein
MNKELKKFHLKKKRNFINFIFFFTSLKLLDVQSGISPFSISWVIFSRAE